MKKGLKHLANLDLYIACTALIVLIIVTFTGVIARYFANSPYVWGEEVMLSLVVWVIWFGASAAFRFGNQICVDMVVDLFPEALQKIVQVLIYILSVILLFYLFSQSFTLVAQLFQTNRVTEVLHIPRGIIYACMPLSCLLMIGNLTYATIRDLRGRNEGVAGDE